MFYLLSFQSPALNQNALAEHRLHTKKLNPVYLCSHRLWHNRISVPSERLLPVPSLPSQPTLPWLRHFQLPCPSPPLGLSALHKNRQAKQEQNESCKIRHFVNVYAARSCFPVTSSGKNLPGLNHWFSLLPRDSASWKGCEGMPGQTDFPDLIFDTDAYTIPPALLPRTWHKHQSFALPAA